MRISNCGWYFHQRWNRSTALGLMSEQTRELKGDDDAANATHEAGYNRVGYKTNVLTEPENTENNLDDACQHNRGKNEGRITA